MKINNYLSIITIIVLIITLVAQNKVIVDIRKDCDNELNTAHTIDSLQHLADSLYDENYPCQIEKNRYEVAFQIFSKRNPKAAEQYAEIISDETE